MIAAHALDADTDGQREPWPTYAPGRSPWEMFKARLTLLAYAAASALA